jgi:hypothetical protein
MVHPHVPRQTSVTQSCPTSDPLVRSKIQRIGFALGPSRKRISRRPQASYVLTVAPLLRAVARAIDARPSDSDDGQKCVAHKQASDVSSTLPVGTISGASTVVHVQPESAVESVAPHAASTNAESNRPYALRWVGRGRMGFIFDTCRMSGCVRHAVSVAFVRRHNRDDS